MRYNIGEDIVSAYLSLKKECDFVSTNVYSKLSQGETDVIGIKLKEKTILICEVAVHLQGLHYKNNEEVLFKKFKRNIEEIEREKKYAAYIKEYYFFSPFVRKKAENILKKLKKNLKKKSINLELLINEDFSVIVNDLIAEAKKSTKELQSPALRFMQIESKLKKK